MFFFILFMFCMGILLCHWTFSIRQILGFSILSNKRVLLKYFKQYISSWIKKIISSEHIVYYQEKSDRHNITNISYVNIIKSVDFLVKKVSLFRRPSVADIHSSQMSIAHLCTNMHTQISISIKSNYLMT